MVKQQGGRFGSVHPFDGDEAVNDGAWHTSTVPPTAADNNLWSSEYVKVCVFSKGIVFPIGFKHFCLLLFVGMDGVGTLQRDAVFFNHEIYLHFN